MSARDDRTRHALLAGGGSGGHVFPALAVADELLDRGWQVSFAGREGGMEERLVAEHGLPFVALPASALVGRGLVDKAKALTTVGRSTLAARRVIRERGVEVVLGTGGYASAPAVVGARLAGVPSLILEPNASSGVANRWLSRFASGALLAYEKTAGELGCPSWVTGIPVRSVFFDVEELAQPGSDDRLRVLVLGGSQGARQLNEEMPRALALLASAEPSMPPLTVVHQCGAERAEETREAYEASGFEPRVAQDETALARGEDEGGAEGEPGPVAVEILPFVTDVSAAMQAAHVVVSRAGALTTAEIAAAGRPSILVPLSLAGAHQIYNARLFEEAGAARVIPGSELTAELLAEALGHYLGSGARIGEAGRAARSLCRREAVAAIADRLEAAARGEAANGSAREAAGRGGDRR